MYLRLCKSSRTEIDFHKPYPAAQNTIFNKKYHNTITHTLIEAKRVLFNRLISVKRGPELTRNRKKYNISVC